MKSAKGNSRVQATRSRRCCGEQRRSDLDGARKGPGLPGAGLKDVGHSGLQAGRGGRSRPSCAHSDREPHSPTKSEKTLRFGAGRHEAGPTWAEQGRAPGSRMRGLRTQGSLDYGGRGRGGSSSRHSQTRNPNPRNQRNPGKHSEERGGVQRGPDLGRAGGRFRVLRGGGTQSAYSSDLPETRTQTLDTDTRPRKKPRKNPTSQKPETAETPLRIGARCVDPRDVEGPSRM